MLVTKILLALMMTMALLFQGTRLELVETPMNSVFYEESQIIVMKCRSSSGHRVSWSVKQYGSAKEELWNGYNMRRNASSYCSIDNSTDGPWNLNIRHNGEAAGTYICLEPGTFTNVSAELIYIKGDPICIDHSTADLVNITCVIEFLGNWPPTMKWTVQSNDGEEVVSDGVNTVTVPNQRVTSTLVMHVPDYSKNITCTTMFEIGGKPPTTTTQNIPEYKRPYTVLINSKGKSAGYTGAVIGIVSAIIIIIALSFCIVCFILAKKKREQEKQKQREMEQLNN